MFPASAQSRQAGASSDVRAGHPPSRSPAACHDAGEPLEEGHYAQGTVKLWRLHEDGRKLFAGTIEAADPRVLVLKWSAFLATPPSILPP